MSGGRGATVRRPSHRSQGGTASHDEE
ncbi:hypothetical protein E2C01_086915 [Portunus trituberculatus]|uniref:Uncharacterized protein n=1 Tax=Portunus trituberculatus TaxID=210409 RepID=A0A5B7JHN4_PORTR|nr:hypothetical protein [Portunus trituberculatus]